MIVDFDSLPDPGLKGKIPGMSIEAAEAEFEEFSNCFNEEDRAEMKAYWVDLLTGEDMTKYYQDDGLGWI
jgi:hypothetical protein